jgi:hypothetical protein
MDPGRHAALSAGARAAAAALLLAVLLAACSLPRSPLLPRAPSPAPDSIDAFVPEAVRFVESHRGLRFKHRVAVRHLSDQAFSARVVQLQRVDQADLARQAKILQALGLLPAGIDPEHAVEELLAGGVIGFYDPKTQELQVRGVHDTVAVRHVVVHELTHALQDQWFSIGGAGTGNDDADMAFTALVEGDAVRVEQAYIASLSAQDRRDLQAQESGQGGSIPPDVPRVFEELLAFPYAVGPAFTRALLQARGQRGLDDAFRHHPTATSQVLHPDRFLNGPAPASVLAPEAGAPAFDQGSIGELGLDLLLEDSVQTGRLTAAQARAATGGWAGDQYVAWPKGAGYCVRDRLATTDAGATQALTGALRQLAATRPGLTVDTAGSQPVLTSCG